MVATLYFQSQKLEINVKEGKVKFRMEEIQNDWVTERTVDSAIVRKLTYNSNYLHTAKYQDVTDDIYPHDIY